MKSNSSWRIRVAQILLGAAIVIALVVVRGTKAGNEPVHLTTDWSHRHLVFSAPHNLGEHIRLLSNPRYNQQLVRRNAERKGNSDFGRWHHAPENPNTLKGDWSVYLGSGGQAGPGIYPAKFSFDAASASCATDPRPDFVVYNTSLLPSAAAVKASQTGTFIGTPGSGQTVTITNTNFPAPNSIVLTSSATLNTGLNWLISATTTVDATNLALAIFRNGAAIGVTASSGGTSTVTITATNTGSENNGATGITLAEGVTAFAFTGGATSLAGGTNGASIVAFDNLYTGTCSVPVPSTYWAYDTGGTVVTSPVLSGGGDQVAFVQSVGTTASLVLLKWAASVTDTVDAPTNVSVAGTTTNNVSNANYRACTAPCMTTIALTAGGVNDTNSSPFYDYARDIIYVGDNGGTLHRFNNVFKGTPAQAVTLGFPHTVTGGGVLTSPVYDDGSSKVFVGSASGILTAVLSTTGAETQTARLDFTNGINDSPLIDTTNGHVFVVVSDDTIGSGGNGAVFQVSTTTLAATKTIITAQHTGTNVYSGAFDQQWFLGNAGSMYVCAAASGSATPTLYQIEVSTGGVLGTVHTGMPLATGTALCSPVTEYFNTGTSTDWIFVSVSTLGKGTAPQLCPTAGSGCIMSFNVTAVTAGAPVTTIAPASTGHATAEGGTSAIVVDGSSALTGASQVYFTPLADQACTTSGAGVIGGCAIQASQSGLI